MHDYRIEEVLTKKALKQFIRFPDELIRTKAMI